MRRYIPHLIQLTDLADWQSILSSPVGLGQRPAKMDLQPSDLDHETWALMLAWFNLFLEKWKTIIVTQNHKHDLWATAIYFIVNICKLDPQSFGGMFIS